MIIHKNKTFNVPSIPEIISSLIAYNIDVILVGSEAGQLHGLCYSTKDIDFLLNTSEENMFKLYTFLKQYFTINNYEEFLKVDRIILLTLDNKPIELFKKLVDEENKIDFLTFETIHQNFDYLSFYNMQVKVINVQDYISYIEKYANHFKNMPEHQEKYLKYQQILQNYSKMIQLHI